jgi:hypothetical protein
MTTNSPGKKPVGRPRVQATPAQVRDLRDQGLPWRKVAKALKIGTYTAMCLVGASTRKRPQTQRARPQTPKGPTENLGGDAA